MTAILLLAIPWLSGCLRMRVSMGISSDDKVSGEIILAVTGAGEGGGPLLEVPPALTSNVRVDPYEQDGYRGSHVYYSGLSFTQFQELTNLSAEGAGRYRLQLRRTGDIVTLEGEADLTDVATSGADVELRVAFPARVATTNGTRVSETQLSWQLAAGELSTIAASTRYSGPGTRSFATWAGLLGGLTIGVAAVIMVVAFLTRDTTPRPGRAPARGR